MKKTVLLPLSVLMVTAFYSCDDQKPSSSSVASGTHTAEEVPIPDFSDPEAKKIAVEYRDFIAEYTDAIRLEDQEKMNEMAGRSEEMGESINRKIEQLNLSDADKKRWEAFNIALMSRFF